MAQLTQVLHNIVNIKKLQLKLELGFAKNIKNSDAIFSIFYINFYLYLATWLWFDMTPITSCSYIYIHTYIYVSYHAHKKLHHDLIAFPDNTSIINLSCWKLECYIYIYSQMFNFDFYPWEELGDKFNILFKI